MTSTRPVKASPAALSCDHRKQVARDFFSRNPGPDRVGLGLGQAVAEFIDWMANSGRLDDHTGSAWWRTMNGRMVLDLDPPAPQWQAYATAAPADAQDALWHAHQQSLTAAIEESQALLDDETSAEQNFIEIVLDVVTHAAALGVATDTDELGSTTGRLYPPQYPISPDQLATLQASLRRPGPST